LHKKYVFQLARKTSTAFSFVLLFSILGIGLGYAFLQLYNYLLDNIVAAKVLMTISIFLYNYFSKTFAFGERSSQREDVEAL